MSIIFLPAKLELKKILAERPPTFKYDEDNFKYIVGLIVRLKSQYKGYLEEDFIPLYSQILQRKIIGYNKYLAYLMENAIIETDNQYIPGNKSRGYRLAKGYAEQQYNPDNITKRSLLKKAPGDVERYRALKKNYGYLTKWFDEGLQIDYDGAVSTLKRLLEKDQQAGKNNALERYQLRLLSIEKLRKGIFTLNVDDTGRRFHSNITNLKSELRNHLTYNGQMLCSVDIKASQPFFSAILFNRGFYEKESQELNLYNLSRTIFKKTKSVFSSIFSIISSFNSINMLLKSDVMQCSSDLELYISLVDKGALYDYLNDQYYLRTGIKFNLSIKEQKNKLKQTVFITLFSDNRFFYQEEAQNKRFFAELFPTVYQIFKLIKRGDNSRLAVILQLIESEIVLQRTTKAISRSYPDLPIFTIHDSIATLPEYKEVVRQELKAQCEGAIGLQPTLSYELWQ